MSGTTEELGLGFCSGAGLAEGPGVAEADGCRLGEGDGLVAAGSSSGKAAGEPPEQPANSAAAVIRTVKEVLSLVLIVITSGYPCSYSSSFILQIGELYGSTAGAR
ncbi:hypothetical protein J2TS4_30020 [Paenibacillus sp. J2TS4]|nr:hypothetical protein J2TS4_30020 [Paenibacillus sp. J2TS4]